VPVSRGIPVLKIEDAEAAAKELGGPLWVVKSQIHAGGRGKGKFKEAAAVKGRRPTPPNRSRKSSNSSRKCWAIRWSPSRRDQQASRSTRLYIEDGSDIEKEFYSPPSSTARRPAFPSSFHRRRHGH